MNTVKLALNRIISPSMPLERFLAFAKNNGFDAVELRNDLPGLSLFDGLAPEEVRLVSETYQVQIATINALQRFNDSEEVLSKRCEELEQLIALARDADVQAIVLCPVNDKEERRNESQRMHDTIQALRAYGPLFQHNGVVGYVEPLGFSQCSLRCKREAIEAIEQSWYASWYKIVHDTFHHSLSEEEEIYPDATGIIHVSGVTKQRNRDGYTDADRVLITADDMIGTKEQVKNLVNGGFTGYISFEPFSEEVQTIKERQLAKALKESVRLLFG